MCSLLAQDRFHPPSLRIYSGTRLPTVKMMQMT